MRVTLIRNTAVGTRLLLAPDCAETLPGADSFETEQQTHGAGPASGPLPAAGSLLVDETGRELMGVLSRVRLPGGTTPHATTGLLVSVLTDLPAGTLPVSVRKDGLALAWVTMSDKGSRGEREDLSGPTIEELCRRELSIGLAQGFVLPDEADALRALTAELALFQGYDLICVTGGTGVGPRDVTPEALAGLLDKRLPGFERAMTAESLSKTPHAMLSRAVVGTLGSCLVLTLPGSRKAVAEVLGAALPAVGHAIEKLQGDTADCGR